MTVSTGTVPTRDSCRRASYAPDKHTTLMELVPRGKASPATGHGACEPPVAGSQRLHVRPQQHCWHPVYD
ncbi:hypothetical protein HPB48_002981 [Haemaphysalis longicornis]|uniref:Uncharacterized protein n=1 Tax=Haemaphysalis longicornis TaxID=44386 RepID=A0A9J6FEI0_HAELO|nr:hypothetical protein HPB48_002981 [Haemaphysalis longicornis]